MDKKIKTIHDVFKLGSRAVINNQDYQLEEIMIWGTAEIIYTILRFIAKNGKVVYEYVKAGRSLADSDGARVVVSSDRVEYKDLSVYGKAFQERVNRSGQEAAV